MVPRPNLEDCPTQLALRSNSNLWSSWTAVISVRQVRTEPMQPQHQSTRNNPTTVVTTCLDYHVECGIEQYCLLDSFLSLSLSLYLYLSLSFSFPLSLSAVVRYQLHRNPQQTTWKWLKAHFSNITFEKATWNTRCVTFLEFSPAHIRVLTRRLLLTSCRYPGIRTFNLVTNVNMISVFLNKKVPRQNWSSKFACLINFYACEGFE